MKNAKRVWFFTDPHIGVRNSSVDWMDAMESYFRDEMLPAMRAGYRDGDMCACLGDVFDSRNAINIRALNIGFWLFSELSKIFPKTVIIVGNHDVFNKSTNEINSVRFLGSIPGVEVHEEPVTIDVGGKSVFLMPWRKDHQVERECLAAAGSHDMLWCHADIRGATFNRRTVIEEGCGESDFANFGRVYTGHIHYRQDKGNVKILGTPYQLTRSDSGNEKGITLLDLSDMSEQFIPNRSSARFIGLQFDRMLQMTVSEFHSLVSGNFVDLYLSAEEAQSLPVSTLLEYARPAKSFQIWPDTAKAHVVSSDGDMGHDFSIENLIREYAAGRKDLSEQERVRLEKGLLLVMRQAEELV